METRQGTALYAADIRPLAPRMETLGASLPPERGRRMREYAREADQLRCLAGWLLMARFLGRDGRLDPGMLTYGVYGKPSLPGGPHFSLAHSGDWVLLAVSEAPVGADLEAWREEDFAALAAVSFHPLEREAFALDPSARNFYALWTLKESCVKLLGTGFSLEPSSLRLSLNGDGPRLEERPDLCFRLYEDLPGYSVALCVQGGVMPERVERVVL